MTFEDLRRLSRGVCRVDFEEFRKVMLGTIKVTEAYVWEAWWDFQNAPLHYVNSREPQTLGERLFELSWKKGEAP